MLQRTITQKDSEVPFMQNSTDSFEDQLNIVEAQIV